MYNWIGWKNDSGLAGVCGSRGKSSNFFTFILKARLNFKCNFLCRFFVCVCEKEEHDHCFV